MKKTIFYMVLWLAFVTSASEAQETKTEDYTISIVTDRVEAIYKKNEKVEFIIKLLIKGQPADNQEVEWYLTKDGLLPVIDKGHITISNGIAKLTGKLSEPGFLQCKIELKLPSQKKLTALGGAAIDPLQIKPSLPAPEDFDAFWQSQKKRLANVPMNIRMTPVKSTIVGVECFDVRADGPDGIIMSGYLARPQNAKNGSLPAMILPHGAGIFSSRLSVAAAWARDGFIAIDFNAHGIPNGETPEFYTKLREGELYKYHLSHRESRDSSFFNSLMMRMLRAIDVVTSQPEWDKKILIANGRSQGGGQAIAAAGLDPRVTFFSAQIPALCDHTGSVVGRINGWPKLLFNDKSGKPDEKTLYASRYYDAVNFASRISATALLTAGFIDVICPPTGVYAAYNNLKGKKQMIDHLYTGHVATAEESAAVRQAILNYIKEAR